MTTKRESRKTIPKDEAEELKPLRGHSRREFLKGVSAAAGATILLSELAFAEETKSGAETTDKPEIPGVRVLGRRKRSLTLRINGKKEQVQVEPRTTLLEAVRQGLGLTGNKEVCGRGSCGACTMLIDGIAVCSCMMLAMDAEGKDVTTIEGVVADSANAALLDAFYKHDAAQCGFCVPGFVVRSSAYLKESGSADPQAIRHGLAGNICRCGAYTKILEAVADAAKGGAR